MSELMSAQNGRQDFRWQLLTTVSAFTLLAAVYGSIEAKAADSDADRPTVWIELGGQLERTSGQGDSFPVGFLAANSGSSVLQSPSPLQAQNPPPFTFAEEGKISFQPENSDWVLSAAINYGRSNSLKHVDHQTNGIHYPQYVSGVPSGNILGTDNFADTQVHRQESHAIADFSVGRDVGLGMFGQGGSSVLNLGVRFAQFTSKTAFDVRARPDLGESYLTKYNVIKIVLPHFHTYHDTGNASRNFHGIGPSLSWNGSAPLMGNTQDGEVTFDWGANAAILFGRQTARVQHHESGHYKSKLGRLVSDQYSLVYSKSGGHDTDRSVIAPNIGGFAGASWRIQDFKISFGYRADFFFGAIDGGIDTRKSETLGFYGPFASVSVGIGG